MWGIIGNKDGVYSKSSLSYWKLGRSLAFLGIPLKLLHSNRHLRPVLIECGAPQSPHEFVWRGPHQHVFAELHSYRKQVPANPATPADASMKSTCYGCSVEKVYSTGVTLAPAVSDLKYWYWSRGSTLPVLGLLQFAKSDDKSIGRL